MSWAETKAAINSTVGTDKFEPLDKIIKGNWRLVASEDFVYASEVAQQSGGSGTYALSNTFKIDANGSIAFAATAAVPQGATYRFNVLRNGSVAASASRAGTSTQLVFLCTTSVSKGDTITFSFTREAGTAPITVSQIEARAYPMYAPELIKSV